MESWVNTVKQHGKTIFTADIEMDEDLLKSVEAAGMSLTDWVLRKEDISHYWKWMPLFFRIHGDEIRVYYINVWKASSNFKKFICARFSDSYVQVDQKSDINKQWIMDRLFWTRELRKIY